MNDAFLWIETTQLSRWLRESLSVFAFPGVLALHTLGLAFLAGPSAAISIRILGAAKDLPLQPLARFFPLMWGAFCLNAVTGLLLIVAYPTKAATNPLFYVKMFLVGAAIVALRSMQRGVFGRGPRVSPQRAKMLAWILLSLWMATLTSGRWLAYTYTRLLATH